MMIRISCYINDGKLYFLNYYFKLFTLKIKIGRHIFIDIINYDWNIILKNIKSYILNHYGIFSILLGHFIGVKIVDEWNRIFIR